MAGKSISHLTCIESSKAGAHANEPFWDAVKKSLDAGQKPVNLKVIRGIKAPCQSE
jgi:hypothetical protein